MDRPALVRRLKERGAELGLGAVGIAPIAPSDHETFLKDWLARGHAGSMDWMARTFQDRVDPNRRFAWARSAVVSATSYLPYRGERAAQPGLVAHIARYAVGRDYHDVLLGRLGALARFIEEEAPGTRTRVYVDTGPVLERELAARAGVGWFGKNTNLIGARGNSWTLLGQILTSLELPPDAPVTDRCGTCTACIDACPTGAIPAPYVLDSTRCISYLTIELKDAIPRDKREGVGDWVFGCDVCQEVCPWNRREEPTGDSAFQAGSHLQESDLPALVRLDETAFRARYAGTALLRPRRRGLVRNALVAAANSRNDEAIEEAIPRLSDPEPIVRGAAAWALGTAGGGRIRRALEGARATETDAATRLEIDLALEDRGGTVRV